MASTAGGGVAPAQAMAAETPQLCYGIDYDFATHKCYFHTLATVDTLVGLPGGIICNAAPPVPPANLVARAGTITIVICKSTIYHVISQQTRDVELLVLNFNRWANVADNVIPANKINRFDIGPMLGQRRRQWANIGPTLGRCLVFAGIGLQFYIGTMDIFS